MTVRHNVAAKVEGDGIPFNSLLKLWHESTVHAHLAHSRVFGLAITPRAMLHLSYRGEKLGVEPWMSQGTQYTNNPDNFQIGRLEVFRTQFAAHSGISVSYKTSKQY